MSLELDSILNSVKKQLGAEIDYEHFDPEIMLNINAAFSTLHQLGAGPKEGFTLVTGDEVWTDYISDNDVVLNMIKSYVYLKVKLIFDPPQVSYVMDAYQQMIQEYEWRIKTALDEFPEEQPEEDPVEPDEPVEPDDEGDDND